MIRRIFLFALVLGTALLGFFAWWLGQPITKVNTEVTIEQGASTKTAASLIAKATGSNAALLSTWFRGAGFVAGIIGGKAKSIKAGTYAIESGLTPYALLAKLVAGDEITLSVTIPEGWTFKQMRAAIDAAPDLKHTTAQLGDEALMTQLGRSGVLAEGRFFPDTYRYAKHSSDLTIYKQAMSALDKRLQAAWEARSSDLPLKTPSDMLILASIVEKETGRPSDRAQIAGVFVNRLKIGMLLQTDPTVIYGMGERFAAQRGNIRKSDLKTDTPYNTYTRAGLPPGPISLVGQAALAAASQPMATDALYFVARGDGSSAFSRTLAQHNAAVNRFIRGVP